jgi:hypothetical protein
MSEFEKLSDEELLGVIESGQVPEPTEEAPDEEPEAEASKTEEIEAAEETEEASPEDDSPERDEPKGLDPSEIQERLRLAEDQAFRARMEAHSSRLAGKIGFLQQELKKARSEGPAPVDGDDDVSLLRREIHELRSQLASGAQAGEHDEGIRQAAIQEAQQFLQDWPEREMFSQEIEQVSPQFTDHYERALQAYSPEEARANVREVLTKLQVAAMRQAVKRAGEHTAQLKEHSKQVTNQKKRLSAKSGASGKRAAPKRTPKTMADLTDDQLKALMDSGDI